MAVQVFCNNLKPGSQFEFLLDDVTRVAIVRSLKPVPHPKDGRIQVRIVFDMVDGPTSCITVLHSKTEVTLHQQNLWSNTI